MDTRQQKEEARRVEEGIALIKGRMPETYKAIQERAESAGREAFTLVRRGLRGEANCFWAMERGHVVGTPFNMPDVTSELARLMVQFGCGFLVMWAPAKAGGADGAH